MQLDWLSKFKMLLLQATCTRKVLPVRSDEKLRTGGDAVPIAVLVCGNLLILCCPAPLPAAKLTAT